MALPRQLPWDQAQTKWASQIDPVLSEPIINGNLLSNVQLNNGVTVIDHLLSRMQQGWVITDMQGAATVYRSSPFNNLTLSLTSNAAITISLWVF